MNLGENITINTHSSIRIEDSKVLYFDPFEISDAKADADIIFITHEHYDHFDPKSIALLKKDDTIIVAPESMKKKIGENDVTAAMKAFFYMPGTLHEIGKIEIEAVAAYNRLMPFHQKSSGWLGYVVTMDTVKYFVAGDTDSNKENEKVKCDVALVPIGGNFTMNKKTAAEYIAKIGPKVAIPTHYGSIVGSLSDGQDFKEKLEDLGSKTEVMLKL